MSTCGRQPGNLASAKSGHAGSGDLRRRRRLAGDRVELDDRGHVVAFSGLSIRPTGHRFAVDARELYTSCAWDTLFLPAMLGQPTRVRSRCPVTGAEVRLTVEPDGVRESDPDPLRVSFPQPGAASTDDITGSFCCHVHFLAGPAAADAGSPTVTAPSC